MMGLVQRRIAVVVMLTMVVACSQQGGRGDAELDTTNSASTERSTAKPTEVAIKDPRGTYADDEGGLSLTFYITGKFSQDLLGETSFGSWSRSGDAVMLTYSDGSTIDCDLKNDGVVYNGLVLRKSSR
ncbi:MAG TPA: hypothetical protein PLW14_12275 [Chlorobiota bacterium]|nr:hypothetical protein [Chlorobiota bacterium]